MKFLTLFFCSALILATQPQEIKQVPPQLLSLTLNKAPLVSNQPFLVPQQIQKSVINYILPELKDQNKVSFPNKAQQAYQKIKKQAYKKSLPKKAIVTTPNNYLYLVVQSDSNDINLLRVVHKHLLQRLFKTNLVVMLVPEALLEDIPVSYNVLDSTSRLVRLKGETQIYQIRMNGDKWTRHRVSGQNFADFGFNMQNVTEVTEAMLYVFQEGPQLK